MGIIGDLLTASTPTRLVYRRGTWSLEIERLVAVERDVYQPRMQRLEGREAIFQHLQRAANNPELAQAANQLIRGCKATEECAFEALDSEWIACAPRAPRESSPPGALSAANAKVAELAAALCLLRATHAGLLARITRLESLLASRPRAREAELPRSVAPPPKAQPPAPLPPEKTLAIPAAVTAGDASELEAEPARPAAPAASAMPAAVPAAKLKFPPASALTACLKTLTGKKIGAREVRPTALAAGLEGQYWFSPLVDDEGNEVGALACDLLATVGLGGALMMFPPAELDAQRAAGTPSEDVLCATAEVMNNLSATINQQSDALHIRVRALQAMTDDNLGWAKSAAQMMDLELADGLGRLLLIAR